MGFNRRSLRAEPAVGLVRRVFAHLHGNLLPFPQALRLVANGGNILHNELDVADNTCFLQYLDEFSTRLMRVPIILSEYGWIRLSAEYVIAPDVTHNAIEIVPGTYRDLPQIRYLPQQIYFPVKRLTAAIIGQTPPLEPAEIVLQGKLPVHFR